MNDKRRDASKVLKRSTLGTRLQTLRERAGITQKELSQQLNLSRSSIAQHERGSANPALETIETMAKLLKTTPEFIAFGTKPVGDFDTEQPVIVSECVFGETVAHRTPVERWGYPLNWLQQELGVRQPEKLIVFKVRYQSVGDYTVGDRVLVDLSDTRLAPPGNFLHWDGVGPTISYLSVMPNAGARKLMLRVKTISDTYEVEADKAQIIGRVLARVSR